MKRVRMRVGQPWDDQAQQLVVIGRRLGRPRYGGDAVALDVDSQACSHHHDDVTR
jgi:hypothetical protein